MSKAKHTPGPWVFDERCHISSQVGNVVVASTGPAARGPYSLDECRANAALIAAAPDLLEALKSFMLCIAPDGTTCRPNKSDFELGRKAIARAEGRE